MTEDTRGNPEGRSLWRNAVTDHHNLKRTCQIELVGIERDMTGLITMEVPLEVLQATSGDLVTLRNEFARMLSSLKRDEREFAMVPPELDRTGMPTGFKLKLLSSGGRRQIDTTAVKRFYKISILQTVLAQFLELGMDKVGALSLASSFTSTFGIALGAILNDVIAEPINEVLIPRLMKLNKVPADLHPTLVPEDIEKPSLDIIGKYLTALFGAGFDLTDPALQRKVFELGGLPIPDDDADDRPGELAPEPAPGEPDNKEEPGESMAEEMHAWGYKPDGDDWVRMTGEEISERDRIEKASAKAAESAVARARRSGGLTRPSKCEKCGDGGKIEAHHGAYEHDKQLEVEWLCRSCHLKNHPRGQ